MTEHERAANEIRKSIARKAQANGLISASDLLMLAQALEAIKPTGEGWSG